MVTIINNCGDNMKKLLSIYIPTYNRFDYLYQQLSVLASAYQLLTPSWRDLVEIIVSDNASTTYNLKKIYTLMFDIPNFYYVKQETNLGILKNAYLSINYCHAEYLWILSDDDFLEKEILSVLMEILQSDNEYNFVFFAHDIYEKHRKIPSLYTGTSGDVGDVYNDLKNKKNFLNNCFQLGLSSALVCKYDLMEKIFDVVPVDNDYAHCWGQLAVFYLIKLGRGYIVEQLYVHKNQVTPPSYNDKLKFVFANVYLGCLKYLPLFGYTAEDISFVTKCYLDGQFNLFFSELLSKDKILRSLSWKVIESFYNADPAAFEQKLLEMIDLGLDIGISVERYRLTDDYKKNVPICMNIVEKITKTKGNRKLIIWGAGKCGIAMYDVLSSVGYHVEGFVDNKLNDGKSFEGVPIINKGDLNPQKDFVIISVLSQEKEHIKDELYSYGFCYEDYVFIV